MDQNYGMGLGGLPTGQEDPYMGNEETYQDHFRKTFITEKQNDEENLEVWTLHDMMIPAGNIAKLIKIPDAQHPDFRVSEVCDKLKFTQPSPVIILAGAMTQRAGKTLAGVCRAAFKTDAFIFDSGIGSGIEKFCLRKNIPLIGIAPEQEVIYPRINPNEKKDNELTNGHTHFILIGDDSPDEQLKQSKKQQQPQKAPQPKKSYNWEDEASIKFDFAKRVAAGRGKKYDPKKSCKMVTVILGDNQKCIKDIEQSLYLGIPVIVLEGSDFTKKINETDGRTYE